MLDLHQRGAFGLRLDHATWLAVDGEQVVDAPVSLVEHELAHCEPRPAYTFARLASWTTQSHWAHVRLNPTAPADVDGYPSPRARS
jgi:hypothetical protein